MTDAIPQVALGLGDNSEYVVMVGADESEATDIAGLLALAPGLLQPAAATDAALAVNHIAQGAAFEVITDPAAFAAVYQARLATEDPTAAWSQHVVRLHDYGVPDFDSIKTPGITGTVLTYFAVDSHLGVPYRVDVDLAAPGVAVTDDSYKAMDLTPLPSGEDEDYDDDVDLGDEDG